MKIRKNLSVNDDKNIYLSPQVEIVVVKIECGFAASVAANESAMAVLLQGERDILKQQCAVESKCQFFSFDHDNPSVSSYNSSLS